MRQLKMLNIFIGSEQNDRIRNENIRGAEQFGDKVRGKSEMIWTNAEEGIVDILDKGC